MNYKEYFTSINFARNRNNKGYKHTLQEEQKIIVCVHGGVKKF